MNKKLLITAIVFYALAFIAACSCVYYAGDMRSTYGDYTSVDAGVDGGAMGMGIIAAALILSGTFFLYKYFTNKPNP
jgi:hypothetical protein